MDECYTYAREDYEYRTIVVNFRRLEILSNIECFHIGLRILGHGVGYRLESVLIDILEPALFSIFGQCKSQMHDRNGTNF